MGLSGGRRGSYRRRLRRKYRKLRRKYAPRQWRAAGLSRAEGGSSQWPFADSRVSLERPSYRQPSRPEAQHARTGREGQRPQSRPEDQRARSRREGQRPQSRLEDQRMRPRRARSRLEDQSMRPRREARRARSGAGRPRRTRRREGLALSHVPVSVIVAAAGSAVIVVAVAAGAVGLNQWVAAGDAANTVPATPSSAFSTAAGLPTERTIVPTPESQRSSAAGQSPASGQAQSVATARPVPVVSQLTPRRGTAWPGLGPDWARPNPRRTLLNAILSGIWSGILQAFLPDPYRYGRYPASCDRAP
jgi:hypothetical protein